MSVQQPNTKAERFERDEARWSAWMKQANAGDVDAYTALLGELSNAIEAYLRSRFGAMDELEDCVQEALLAIHRARRTYDGRRKFRPWLFAIVKHKTIDSFRRAEVRRRGRGEYKEERAQAAEPGPGPDSRMDGGNLLLHLDPDYREAIELTKLLGYTVPEAAEKVGVSTAAMKNRVHRGLKKIRALLEREELDGAAL